MLRDNDGKLFVIITPTQIYTRYFVIPMSSDQASHDQVLCVKFLLSENISVLFVLYTEFNYEAYSESKYR